MAVGGSFHIVGNTFIALAADADRELDCLAGADLFFPGRAGLAQIVRKYCRCP